ncbi:ferrous iron permease EfeU [Paenibacillus baekrokdamisoli]|uniref:Ferrous iron permease EfeU n=1 Tax=Paenibacillus baekrokdamisoli TaxID=1712516 RepID=A0A3G9JLF0_9BACL|nr:FTR1 family protein [Paenibacillus baekrokdamisoli]MBB3069041.1 high-affinity iron transporter [Paenibacillus baekrokdamisoli]BBH23859.1 ferrous iron permease EfeU [Paenibacillus baekrokdamisoli]
MNLQAFLILFREGFEAILIVGIIISYLNRIGQSKWNKYVWVGVALAVLASLGVAMLFQIVLDGYSTMGSKDYLRIAILLVSAGLLTHMILFMSKQNREMRSKLQNKVSLILTTGGAVNMIVHSFLVTLREGVETVFFFAAISQGDISQALQSWGAVLGLLTAVVLGLIVFKSSKKVQIGTFFKVTSIFLIMIAAGLFVQAIGVMQDLKIIGSVYKTSGGEIGQMYDLTWLMPEHPIDETNYIRDTGHHPMIKGQVGIFFKAFLGYTQDPSLEEFVGYWMFYGFVFVMLARQKRLAALADEAEANRSTSSSSSNVTTADSEQELTVVAFEEKTVTIKAAPNSEELPLSVRRASR